jgi:hypothetical protein
MAFKFSTQMHRIAEILLWVPTVRLAVVLLLFAMIYSAAGGQCPNLRFLTGLADQMIGGLR